VTLYVLFRGSFWTQSHYHSIHDTLEGAQALAHELWTDTYRRLELAGRKLHPDQSSRLIWDGTYGGSELYGRCHPDHWPQYTITIDTLRTGRPEADGFYEPV